MRITKLGLLTFLHVLNDGFLVSLPLLLPFIKDDLHLTLTQVGILGSMLSVLAVFLALPSGFIANRFGGLHVLVYALGCYSLGYLALAVAPDYSFIVLAFLGAGVGFGVFHPIALALVARWAEKSQRGKSMANFTALGDIGRVGISAGLTFLVVYMGWRYTSSIYGLVAFALFFVSLKFLLPRLADKSKIEKKKVKTVSLRYLAKHPPFIFASLADTFDSFASSSLFIFLPFLLLSKGINPAMLGSFTSIYFIGHFIGKTTLGRLVDRFGSARVFVLAEAAMALSILALALVQFWPLVVVVSFILGVLTKGTAPVINSLAVEVMDEHGEYEKAFALKALMVNAATAVAPSLFGFVADHLGITHVFTISAVFALAATLPVFAIQLMRATKK